MEPVMRPFALLLATALATTVALPAQITSLSTTSIGPNCNIGPVGCCMILGGPTQLVPSLDVAAQQVQMEVTAIEGCCGVQVPLRALALGTTPVLVPLPEFGPACALHVAPIVLLAAAANPFVIPLPPGLPPVTFLAQGAALITDPFTGAVLTLTDGLSIALQ
jgi:hypothetical protein